MKILLIGLGYQIDMIHAFQKYGEVIYWDWTKHSPHFNASLKYLAEQHKPDLIFMQIQTPGIVKEETILKIKEGWEVK